MRNQWKTKTQKLIENADRFEWENEYWDRDTLRDAYQEIHLRLPEILDAGSKPDDPYSNETFTDGEAFHRGLVALDGGWWADLSSRHVLEP